MNRSQLRKIIKETAKSKNVSVSEVKREMQTAINSAYKNPTSESLKVPRKKDIPTIKEFIEYTSQKLLKKTT